VTWRKNQKKFRKKKFLSRLFFSRLFTTRTILFVHRPVYSCTYISHFAEEAFQIGNERQCSHHRHN
jgi:hypothetical protein